MINHPKTITEQIEESITIKRLVLKSPLIIPQIELIASECFTCIKNGGKVIFAGNGGSFADAQHLSAEFTSKYAFDRESLASLALGCNNSAISAIGNDYGYDKVFSRELSSIANKTDVFIAISTSGNSPNILSAIETALKKGIKVFGLTGQDGGKMSALCKCVCVPSDQTGRIQEVHIMIGHILCSIIEDQLIAK